MPKRTDYTVKLYKDSFLGRWFATIYLDGEEVGKPTSLSIFPGFNTEQQAISAATKDARIHKENNEIKLINLDV